MGLGDFIILIAFAVGYLIIFIYQKKKIGTLITQIKSQGEILKQTERFMNIFNLDKVDKFVQISEKTTQMEKGLAIKEIKSTAQESFNYILKEYGAVLGLAFKLVDGMAYFPTVEFWLEEMEDVQTKPFLLNFLERRRMELESEGIDKRGWVANFIMGMNLWGKIVEEEKKT